MNESTAAAALSGLPALIRKRVEDWTRELEEALGEDLVGVVVHGAIARGEYRPEESELEAIVVLRTAGFAQLDAMSNAMRLARYGAHVEVMILTEDEIAGASDVFPLLYDEIKRCHVLLAGRNPFAEVEVHDTHRRLRIEQELRNARIRLRRAVTDALGARDVLADAVVRKLRDVRGPLHALLSLRRVACAPQLAAVLAKAGGQWGVDVRALGAPREEPDAAYEALSLLLDRAIRDVNGLEPSPAGGD